MRPTDTFRAQHAELLAIVGDISGLLSEDKISTQSKEVSRLLAQFNGKLKGHLAMEDRALYPKLMAHKDPRINNLANRFSHEMGGIAEAVVEYSSQWASASAIAADSKNFILQTKRLFAVLGKRISSEDTILYHALDEIS